MRPTVFERGTTRARGSRRRVSRRPGTPAAAASQNWTRGEPAAQPSAGPAASTAGRSRGGPATGPEGSGGACWTAPGSAAHETSQASMCSRAGWRGLHLVSVRLDKQRIQMCRQGPLATALNRDLALVVLFVLGISACSLWSGRNLTHGPPAARRGGTSGRVGGTLVL